MTDGAAGRSRAAGNGHQNDMMMDTVKIRTPVQSARGRLTFPTRVPILILNSCPSLISYRGKYCQNSLALLKYSSEVPRIPR